MISATIQLELGEGTGHPFRGNQYTSGLDGPNENWSPYRVRTELRDAYPNAAVGQSSIPDKQVPFMSASAQGLVDLAEKFPEAAASVRSINYGTVADGTGTLGTTSNMLGPEGVDVSINLGEIALFDEESDPIQTATTSVSRYSPVDWEKASYAIATHEFGHVVDYTANRQGVDVFSQIQESISADQLDEIEKFSEYATLNPSEAFAEAFTAKQLGIGGVPRELGVAVRDALSVVASAERQDVIRDTFEGSVIWEYARKLPASAEFGEGPGHEFRGNQYTGPFFGDSVVGRVGFLADGKAGYARTHGLEKPSNKNWAKIKADPERGARIASDYAALPMRSPDAIPAYNALRDEVGQQYQYLTQTLGVKVDMVSEDPYRNVEELRKDLIENKHLSVLSTESTGPHPYLSNTENDQFRAVHDAFGHAAIGRGFDRNGEEAAYQSHAQMFSALATQALATETRGQNSSLVYGGTDTFPPQKLALLPTEDTIVAALIAAAQLLNADDDNRLDITHSHHASLGRSLHRRAEEFGESSGHPFRGNQYTQGEAGDKPLKFGGLLDRDPEKPGWQHPGTHRTNLEAWKHIQDEGFDPMAPERFGSVYGKGSYFTLDTPAGREAQLAVSSENSPVRIEATITMNNPIVMNGPIKRDGWTDAPSITDIRDKIGVSTEEWRATKDRIVEEHPEYSGYAPEAEVLTTLAKERGYDGIIVRADKRSTGDRLSWDQLVVFDGKQVEVTSSNVGHIDFAASEERGMVLLSVPQFLKRNALIASVELGEDDGHPFRGNQYTGGVGGGWEASKVDRQADIETGLKQLAQALGTTPDKLNDQQREFVESMHEEKPNAREYRSTIGGKEYTVRFDDHENLPREGVQSALSTLHQLAEDQPFWVEGDSTRGIFIQFDKGGGDDEPGTLATTMRGFGTMYINDSLIQNYERTQGESPAYQRGWFPGTLDHYSQLTTTLAHEWGHAIDSRMDGAAKADANEIGTPSIYGAQGGEREAYAEAFSEYWLNGETSSKVSREYAEKYDWPTHG